MGDRYECSKGNGYFQGEIICFRYDQLVEIDMAEGKISNRYPAEGAIFLNDVAASKDGKIFVSESRTGKIKKMIETAPEKINTADTSFAKALNLLLVPTFFDNQVTYYQIEITR